MGEGPAQIFCPLSQTVILGNFGDGEGGGDPYPNFWHIGVPKKVVQVFQIRGRGGGGDLDKIQKNS